MRPRSGLSNPSIGDTTSRVRSGGAPLLRLIAAALGLGLLIAAGDAAKADSRFKEFPIPTANSPPVDITVGPDRALWFVESNGNKIGRICVLSHAITEVAIPTANSKPFALTTGPDLHLWFVEVAGNNVGRYNVLGDGD